LALASLVLGEKIGEEWLTYIPIWLAVLVLVLRGVTSLQQRRRKQHLELI
jgi:chloramphenicol-sensitive protein RarD